MARAGGRDLRAGGGPGGIGANRLLAGAGGQGSCGCANRYLKRALGGILRTSRGSYWANRHARRSRAVGGEGRALGEILRTGGLRCGTECCDRRTIGGLARAVRDPGGALGHRAEDRANGGLLTALGCSRGALGMSLRAHGDYAHTFGGDVGSHGWATIRQSLWAMSTQLRAQGLERRALGDGGLRADGLHPRAFGGCRKLRANGRGDRAMGLVVRAECGQHWALRLNLWTLGGNAGRTNGLEAGTLGASGDRTLGDGS